ncbi:putative uncharacterized protein FLJ46235 [Gorilla gorilla gorilla]|uniref:putative uncharacterized protein FLJ46235 n=1 Tax=Gorilla gorilla gorilla TaxID=9595 RepID=UPI0024465714|nr:putative uncharacterized protein FLJ46235 [Gorilla gorilla gorilla]
MKAQNLLKLTSPGPVRASCQRLQAQPLPHGGFSRPSSSSWLSLQAQLLPHNSLFWPSSCPAHRGQCRPKTSSSQTLQAHLLLPGGMNRPSFDLRIASAGPALASQGLLQAQLLPHGSCPRPSFCLPASSLNRHSSSLTVAHLGPTHDCRAISRPSACLLADS